MLLLKVAWFKQAIVTIDNRKKIIQYQNLVLNDRPFGNALAVSFFRRCARLHLCAYDFHCRIQKRRGKLGRIVSFNESHVQCTLLLISPRIQRRYRSFWYISSRPKKLFTLNTFSSILYLSKSCYETKFYGYFYPLEHSISPKYYSSILCFNL